MSEQAKQRAIAEAMKAAKERRNETGEVFSTTDFLDGFDAGAGYAAWVPVNEKLPEPGQTVAFVVKITTPMYAHENGRVLGGRYTEDGYFTVPGCAYDASYWMPLPDAPQESR